MARSIHCLNALTINNTKKPGYYSDGGGLYLQVSQFGTKSWVFRFSLNKKREMGLGPTHDIPLKKAREMAQECRLLVREGVDPIIQRKERLAALNDETNKFITFKDCALKHINDNKAAWANPKHAKQWESTLVRYAFPVIGPLPISSLETQHIMDIISPIWADKNETARRLRGRIESIIDSAKVKKLYHNENPARWKGHLDKLLPKPSKVAKVTHHASMPYQDLPVFIKSLHESYHQGPLRLSKS